MNKLPSKKMLHNLFDYFDGTLICKITNGRSVVGKPIGWMGKDGYRRTKIAGINYLVHRLIWCWHYGPTNKFIDHKDRNKGNCKIHNLRLGNQRKNVWNSSFRKDNTTGFRNVYLRTRKYARNDKISKWFQAQITFKGKVIYLGRYSTAEKANAVCKRKIKRMHGRFYAGNH